MWVCNAGESGSLDLTFSRQLEITRISDIRRGNYRVSGISALNTPLDRPFFAELGGNLIFAWKTYENRR